jgi:single-strand DNA-binding protein
MTSPISLTGRLVKISPLAFSPSGAARCTFTIATSRRVKDDTTGKWNDTDTTYWRCTAWRNLAEHLTDSELPMGTEVLVLGDAKDQSWTKDGQEHKALQVTAKTIAVGISRSPVTLKRTKPTTEAATPTNTTSAWDEDPWTAN